MKSPLSPGLDACTATVSLNLGAQGARGFRTEQPLRPLPWAPPLLPCWAPCADLAFVCVSWLLKKDRGGKQADGHQAPVRLQGTG